MTSLSRPLRTLFLVLGLTLFSIPAIAGDALFQYSTIDALLAGLYDGRLTMGELMKRGDFGLGTLNGLDGELVVVDGTPYHVTAGGKALPAPDSALVPFASVSSFGEDSTLKLAAITSMEALNEAVSKGLPSENIFYAIRIDATFSNVKTRAIPRQKPPYEPLATVVQKQVIVNFSGPGTLVGYYSPPFVKGVNVPGFHWHFLTEDRTGGGHVLDCVFEPATARLDALRSFTVKLPDSEEFAGVDLTKDKAHELEKVEKDHPKQ